MKEKQTVLKELLDEKASEEATEKKKREVHDRE